ncbi:hypothetical protein B0J12DRAFT_292960 [Macrophomina phaseolina]|uniref:Uncharacterized protein n=1 Tax=Macrophomina phaseolina TaxID=35725 RepID=A0ABQ8GPB5_9PEZI|nr:hypothetical protein B0J12DRAFT_292960 [Macrophomina phaseolina]
MSSSYPVPRRRHPVTLSAQIMALASTWIFCYFSSTVLPSPPHVHTNPFTIAQAQHVAPHAHPMSNTWNICRNGCRQLEWAADGPRLFQVSGIGSELILSVRSRSTS